MLRPCCQSTSRHDRSIKFPSETGLAFYHGAGCEIQVTNIIVIYYNCCHFNHAEKVHKSNLIYDPVYADPLPHTVTLT